LHCYTKNEPRSVKRGFNACALTVVPDWPVQTAQANQGRHLPPKLDFR
jgi:hypothetical protein